MMNEKMSSEVSIEEKKYFLKWFLKQYKLKRRECVWILNYLLDREAMLQNIVFTDDAHYCPRAMVISTTKSDSIPFRFYNGNLMTADAEKSFHDLRLNPEEKMYIQLNFPDNHICPKYIGVKEENPFKPDYLQVSEKDQETARLFIKYMEKQLIENSIAVRIDEALKSGDEETFMKLTNELKIRSQ